MSEMLGDLKHRSGSTSVLFRNMQFVFRNMGLVYSNTPDVLGNDPLLSGGSVLLFGNFSHQFAKRPHTLGEFLGWFVNDWRVFGNVRVLFGNFSGMFGNKRQVCRSLVDVVRIMLACGMDPASLGWAFVS